MTTKISISTLDLVNCFSSTLDLISPSVMHHHKRVAYIAWRITEELNLPPENSKQIFLASLLHDVGALSLHDRLNTIQFETDFEHSGLFQHSLLGQFLLKEYFPFSQAASLVGAHHLYWQDREDYRLEDDTLLGSQIIHLADRTDVLINKNQEILGQVPSIMRRIEGQSGKMFCPELIKVLKTLAEKEYFWLDIVNPQIIGAISAKLKPDVIQLDSSGLLDLAKTFCHIIDFRSPFTATHSAGVSASVQALAGLMNFTGEEARYLKIAGYLHDLGKLAIPEEILEKPAKLTETEFNIIKAHAYYGYRTLETVRGFEKINTWSTLHHERLDGNGYPFHLAVDKLPLGSRIMAVADIFTALLEDRPYRKGMTEESALQIISEQAESGAIDQGVVAVLKGNMNQINSSRRQAQQKAGSEYEAFRAII
jgi:HD-GYP domain-containing protein (c-di-GMP phosphodiesterase class II)